VAKLETEHVFNGSIEKVFSALRQYEKYPDYLPGVTKIEVLPSAAPKSVCQVRYELKIIKEFFYILNMFEESPKKLWWELADSNIMKANSGAWLLKKLEGGKTKATYQLDVKLRGFVPRTITDRIAETNLPAMLVGFQKLIDDHGEG